MRFPPYIWEAFLKLGFENRILPDNHKRKERLKIKDLTSKEKLFCTYYSISRNGREAAAKSGYVFPEKSALRLLRRENVVREIERLDESRKQTEKDISAGYFRLAFGCVSDAVKLLFSDDVDVEKIEEMDLFNISEIKRKKGGDIEIKFFDRLKALQYLYEMSEPSGISDNAFYTAIEKGAAALKGESFG